MIHRPAIGSQEGSRAHRVRQVPCEDGSVSAIESLVEDEETGSVAQDERPKMDFQTMPSSGNPSQQPKCSQYGILLQFLLVDDNFIIGLEDVVAP